MSKYLIEAVNCFGINGLYGDEYGPFYSGINCVICIPSFRIRLYGPTSTTTQQPVANNFAKEDGIILSLNNTERPAINCRFFNVSWLSRYPEEAERLFVHGMFIQFLFMFK